MTSRCSAGSRTSSRRRRTRCGSRGRRSPVASPGCSRTTRRTSSPPACRSAAASTTRTSAPGGRSSMCCTTPSCRPTRPSWRASSPHPRSRTDRPASRTHCYPAAPSIASTGTRMPASPLHVVILAAGEGKRMKSRKPKVLMPLAGRPLLAHVLATARALSPATVHVVYGHAGEQVHQAFAADPDIDWVEQAERLGTGHALAQALAHIPDGARVLVLYGDVPLLRAETLAPLAGADDLALLVTALDDPHGYGRVLRDADGRVAGVVEEKDADAAQRAIQLVNTGILAGDAAALRGWLERLDRNT